MRYCAVCKKKFYSGSGITLFRVPKNPAKRANWSEICGRKLASSSYICQDHFLPTSIVHIGKNKHLLLSNAEPSPRLLVEACTDISSVSNSDFRSNNPEETNESSSDNTSFNSENGRHFSWEQFTKTAAESVGCSTEGNFKNKINHFAVNNTGTPNISNSPKNECESPSTQKKFDSSNLPTRPKLLENHKKVLKKKFLKRDMNFMPPQLEEPIVQMPVVKSVSCSARTQTNIRLCGLVEASDLADDFRLNCFYCADVFPLEKWKDFINHLKDLHFKEEEAFRTSEYLSKEHDYTPISLPSPTAAKTTIETVIHDAKPAPGFSVDPLGSVHNPFESIVFNSSLDYKPYRNKSETSFVAHGSRKKSRAYKNYSKRKLKSSNRLYSKLLKQQTSKESALSRCLKRTIEDEITSPTTVEDATCSFKPDPEIPTEIAFEYTPRPIVNLLLDNMKNFPVLWHFDDEPFNEDFFEAAEELCNIINNKFSLNIDNLKMRRSINRIIRFYCYIFPNENNDQFTYYYDKCASFLPSVSEIAYARCSHCYVCYDSDFDLQLHLVEEQRYLEWPYKCPQCKECFRLWDEIEFHKHLPHYDEIFRCQPCKLSFFRRLSYKKHMVEEHNRRNEPGRFKCDICDRTLETMNGLRAHKRTHGEAPHKCHLCPKSFHEKSKLVLHVKTHLNETDFMCEICGTKFIRQPALNTHMTTHTGEKVTCKICNLSMRKSSLGRHLRTMHVAHAGPITKGIVSVKGKQIKIGRIFKALPRKPYYRKSGSERMYKCKICKLNFDSYKMIVLHNQEMHSDLPKWQCKMCSAEIGLKLNLKGHYRKKHGLHPFQIYKLVEKNEDLNEVLSIDVGEIEEFVEVTKSSTNNPEDATEDTTETNIKPSIKTDLLPDEIYFAEEKIHSSVIQDEIMKAVDDIETHDIKIDYMDDMFTEFLE